MSTCIGPQGEYSEHVFEGETLGSRFNCARCYAFDEDAADAAVRNAEALLTEVRRLVSLWDDQYSLVEPAAGLVLALSAALDAPSEVPHD